MIATSPPRAAARRRATARRRGASLWLAALLLLSSVGVVTAPAQAAEPPATSRFQPLQPQRILDTRIGLGAPRGRPRPGTTVVVQVTGVAGVPATDVTAVMAQVTVTDTWTAGYVQALPTGSGAPGASSNVNVTGADQTASNLVTVPVGTGGTVSLLDVAGGHLLVDVVGYFTRSGSVAAGRYRALTPTRVLDSRTRLGMPPVAPPPDPVVLLHPGDVIDCGSFPSWTDTNSYFWTYLPDLGDVALLDPDGDLIPCEEMPGASPVPLPPVAPAPPGPTPILRGAMQVQIGGAAGIPPDGASAAVLTVTATESAAAGYLQVVPTGSSTGHGSTSNVNLTGPGQTAANLVVVPLGPHGTVDVYSAGGTHVVVDVVGYFTGDAAPVSTDGLFVPVTPTRLEDSRSGVPLPAGSQRGLLARGRAGIPSDGVSALVLNATATQTAGPGYLQLFPTGLAAPGSSSSVNYTAAGQTVATAVVGNLGDGGTVSVHTPTRTHVVVDVFGYFTGRPAVATPAAHPLLRRLAVTAQSADRFVEPRDFPYWVDADGDCQDTRTEVLLAESRTRPVLDATGCTVVSGTWVDPYSGRTHTSAADVVVDHTVPVGDAFYSGAWRWDLPTRRAFANYLADDEHLTVVGDETHAAARGGPALWRPDRTGQWCAYATDWATIKATWGLTVTPTERDGLAAMLATC